MPLSLYDKQAVVWRGVLNPKFRNLIFCGGVQCGKTTLGAALVTKLACSYASKTEDTGIIAAPTYKILQQATLPKFLTLNEGFGIYNKAESAFTYHWGFKVYMRTATKPESMEGISNCRFAWGDEAGLFPRYFYENLMGRVARLQGPLLFTTTPYAMNWLAELAAAVIAKKRDDSLLMQVRSVDSPYFPKEEFDRQQKLLDPRRFAMKYMGQFGKMQGLVYPDVPMCKSHSLPPGTKFYGGVDWGFTDPFALVVRAVTPEGIHYRVNEYVKSGVIASEMFDVIRAWHQIYNFDGLWADPSRPEYIEQLEKEYNLPIQGGNNEIRIGIDCHIKLMREQRFFVWEDMNPHGKDEYEMYHYPEPKELSFDDDSKEQNPVDANNHTLDADRYCTMGINDEVGAGKIAPYLPSKGPEMFDLQQRIAMLRKSNRVRVL
jgi:hypothetical protein